MLNSGPFKLATLNVRGLGSKKRRFQLKTLLEAQQIDILGVQETKVESESHTDTMVEPFLDSYHVAVSHAQGTAGGCCMFLKKALISVIDQVQSSPEGRFVCCDFNYAEHPFRAVCVYAPTKTSQRRVFFEEVVRLVDCEKCVLFFGDFNCVYTPADRANQNVPSDSSALFLEQCMNDSCLEDVTNLANATRTARYTHYQGASHARLDRIYVSAELAPSCMDYAVDAVSFSDHCLVSVCVGGKKQRQAKFNWDLWKMNDKLLKDDKFQATVVARKTELVNFGNKNIVEEWESFKQEIKIAAIERSTEIKFNDRKEEKELRDLLQLITVEEAKAPGLFTEDLRTTKAKIERIEVEKYKGAAIRARTERLIGGEMPTKRSLADERSHARRNEIHNIEHEGIFLTEQVEIEGAFTKHYEHLFSCKTPNQEFEQSFLTLMSQLDPHVTDELQSPITVKEIEDSIDSLNIGKSPGPDGLGAAFYKAFKIQLAPILGTVLEESFNRGSLPPSFSQAHTILIPKSNDPEQLVKITGYRPITLTNTDYKIFMKVITKRMQAVITTLVGPHQTCGIKGRSITTNIHVARSILESCDIDYRKVAMLQIDFQKAFDRVCHEVLFKILEHVRIGKLILQGVKMAYKDCTTRILINGQLTSPIKVQASVRQGCALSSLLFALYLEPLCARINQDNQIQGYTLQSCEVKVMAYADDVVYFCVNKESVRTALCITQEFCSMTCSSINIGKCTGLWHGEWLNAPNVFENVTWSTQPTKYLGVPFDQYRDSTKYWNERAQEMRAQTAKWEGRGLSIFSRATVCNVFLVSKIWYVMQALSCSRLNVQKFHRIFAVFVWQSTYERTSRNNLFRKVRSGGLSLSHLFVRQLVSRFLFLRDQADPFIRTFLQVTVASALPDLLVTSADATRFSVSLFLREVVFSCRFLMARFSREFLSTVNRKNLSRDLIDCLFPEPMYRSLYSGGSGHDVLRRVKRMLVPGPVKTFFFKLHTNTLPVKTWMLEKGLFLPWGADCTLCKKPESVEHVFIDCWDAVFFWDVLQRTVKKDLPLTPHGIRFLDVKPDVLPYDLFFVLGLHSIWKSRMEVRNADVNAKSVGNHFVEHVCKLREVFLKLEYEDEVISVMNELAVLKVHKNVTAS